jgi:hypothetical protein
VNAADPGLSHHPAPKRHAVRLHESFFALFGGPLAWFVQLNVGFALASQPCFRDGERMLAPRFNPDWTWTAMIAATVIACVIGLLAALISWRAYVRTLDEGAGGHRHVLEVGSGRTRFLALWGVVLGAGAALATGLTAVAFFVLPRCAG